MPESAFVSNEESCGRTPILGFESPRGIPVVELVVGGHKIKAHIDSGNMIGGFVLPTSLVEKLSLSSPPRIVGRARTVSSDIEIKEARLKEPITNYIRSPITLISSQTTHRA